MIIASMVKELRERTGAGMLDCKKALEATDGNMEKAIDWLREKGISKAAKKSSRIAAEGIANVIIEGNEAVIIEINSETDFVAKNDEFKKLVNLISTVLIKNNVNTVDEALKIKIEEGTLKDTITKMIAIIGEKIELRRFIKVIKNDNEIFGSYLHMGGKIATLCIIENSNDEVAKDVAMHIAAMNPLYLDRDEVPIEEVEKEKSINKEQIINDGKPEEIVEKIVEGKINKYFKEVCLKEQIFIKNNDMSVGKYVENNGGLLKKMFRYEVGEGIERKE